MLINTAYKSCRVLRELQMDGKPNPSMTQQAIKAKYVVIEITLGWVYVQVMPRAEGATDRRETES